MSKDYLYRCLLLMALLFSVVAVAGCNDSGRYPLKGSVTFDGEPVEWGYVQFSPMAGTTGPTSGADVKNGTYAVATERGLFKESYRVDVKAWKRSSKKFSIDTVTGEKVEGGGVKQFLPKKYNDDSELTVEIGGGQSEFDFDLEP
jgi:hypothetical protein